MSGIGIRAMGKYVPQRVLTNDDLERMVDTSDEWIVERTGIRERHIAAPEEAASDLAYQAFKDLEARFPGAVEDISLIVVATVTPDHLFPTTANILQHRLGFPHIPSYDILAACSGFLYALANAYAYLKSGLGRQALVFGTEVMSRIVNWQDRRTCVLFGDGAGVCLLGPVEEDFGILDIRLRSDGSGAEYLYMPAGGSRLPPSPLTVARQQHTVHMNGREVFSWAVRRQGQIIEELLEANDLRPEDVRLFVLHQANYRIIKATWTKFRLPRDRFYINIDRYGNTTAASIPLALYEAYYEGRLEKGDLVVVGSFGAGFTWGAILMRWALPKPV